MKPRVLLISTIHPATDPRIVYKIAPSLASDYEVFCALPNSGSEIENNIQNINLPFFEKLWLRILLAYPVVLWKCLRLRPALVHIFVAELIPLAFLFQWFGAKVIYEVQENLYKKFALKRANHALFFQIFFRYFDQSSRKAFHLIFTEKAYLKEYNNLKKEWAVVHNYVSLPFIDRFSEDNVLADQPVFFYSGVISMERSFDVLVEALVKLKAELAEFHVHLFGPVRFSENEAKALPGYEQVEKHITFHGYTDLKIAVKHARKAVAGIALLKPVADYPESYTTKLFEYMALNLPVLTSDFPLYKEVVERADCGFCISPYDAEALAGKLNWFVKNPEPAREMGKRGRKAAEMKYNWNTEETELLSFYRKILVNNLKNVTNPGKLV